MELEVPLRSAFVELDLDSPLRPVRVGRYRIESSPKVIGENTLWTFTVTSPDSRLTAANIIDAQYWFELLSAEKVDITEKANGSLELSHVLKKGRKPLFWFRIIEGKKRMSFPFVLKGVELPR